MYRKFQTTYLFVTCLVSLLVLSFAAIYSHRAEAAAPHLSTNLSPSFQSACTPIISGDRAGDNGTTHDLTFDGRVKSYFDSSYDNWQYVEIDFNCVGEFAGLRRYMTRDGRDTSGNRGPQGEGVSFSLDGVNWTELTGPRTTGWESYVNYGTNNEAWHSVIYGWSEWLKLQTPVQARFVRFNWDDNKDALNEIEVALTAVPPPTATPTPTAVPSQDNAPPDFANFAPTAWVTDTHQVEVSIESTDSGSVVSGLNPDSAVYRYSTDARKNWSAWLPATADFRAGSPQTELLSATIDFGRDSEDTGREGDSLHWVAFQISDMAGNPGLSREYPVHIDTTPPEPRGFLQQSHTPNQWSTDSTVFVQWIQALEASSGLAGYDVQWVQLTAQNPDCPNHRGVSAVTPPTASTSPPLTDATNWHVCIWPLDNAGHWAIKPLIGGPYWIDAQPPLAITNLHSPSHGATRWSNIAEVEMAWTIPVGGAAGYAYVWDHSANTTPTMANTTTNTQLTTILPADHNNWYFHIAPFDQAGNFGPVSHFGPFGLDRTAPGAPFILGPPNGWITNTVTVRWTPQGAAPGSPVDAYSYEWIVNAPVLPPDELVDTLEREAANETPFPHGATVFLIVKGRDRAGNWGPTAVAGPYNVDAVAPNCKVTGVLNDTLLSSGSYQYLSLLTEFELDVTIENPPGTSGSPEWVDVEYSPQPNGPWTTWLYQGSGGTYEFSGAQQNASYFFRCRAGDEAGNVNPFAPERTRVTVHVPDLRITRVEVTQGIQDTTNSVPLVEGKPTWVRVYIDDPGMPSAVANTNVPNVVVVLYGLAANGAPLPGSPLGPACLDPAAGCTIFRTIRGLESKPGESESTVNFYLPPSWLEDEITLLAEVNPPILPGNTRAMVETAYGNNLSPSQSHEFAHKNPLTITPIRINYLFDPANPLFPATDAYAQTVPFTRKVWPADVEQRVLAGPDFLDFTGDLTTGAGWSQLLNEMVQMRANASGPYARVWYGLVPPLANSAVLGKAYVGGVVSAALTGTPNSATAMAHEIAHNLGRGHAPCGATLGLDPNYPDPDGNIGAYGFDPITAEVYLPSTKDVMTYCAPIWISPYTFEGLFDATSGNEMLTIQSAAEPSQSYLMVSGLIMEDGVLFNPLYRFGLPAESAGAADSGAYRIELQDSNGRLLAARAFELFGDLTVFNQTMPEPEGLARVILLRDGRVLGQIIASDNAPEVTLLQPGGGQALSGTITARWTAADADGDDLTFALQYSPDGGETWSPIVHGLTETSYTFSAHDLAGSERGLLKVVASDGFHSTADTSDEMLELPDHAPQATILHPINGARFTLEQVVVLQGQGLDKEDGELPAERLIWSSDRDGRLGSGRELAPQGLSDGWHTITLTVTDSDGRRSSASVRLYVGTLYESYLPWVRR